MWSARVSFHALVPCRTSIPSFARYSSGCRLGGFKQVQPHHYSFLPLMMASYSSDATPNKVNIYTGACRCFLFRLRLPFYVCQLYIIGGTLPSHFVIFRNVNESMHDKQPDVCSTSFIMLIYIQVRSFR